MPMTSSAVLAILDALEAAGIEVAVAGGWAVDALLGHATRDHGDLDLAIDADEVERAIEALDALGLVIHEDQRPARVAVANADRTVDLHPVVWGPDGVGQQRGLEGEVFEYPPGSTASTGRIADREVRCLSPELLLRFREGYAPRAIDRADVAALTGRFGLPTPAGYVGHVPEHIARRPDGGA